MNKKTFKNNKKAFSLIELSIVLIIMGLLVAAVAGGANLIKNAERRNVISEAYGYATSVNAFYDATSGSLPGDYNNVIGTMTPNASTTVGNSNGAIEFVNGAASTAVGRVENNIAWQHLVNGGYVSNDFTPAEGGETASAGGAFTTDLVPGTNIPNSKIGGAGWVFDNVSSQNVVILTGSISTNVTLTASTAANATPTAAITPLDALSIDEKIDGDAVANAGKLRAHTTPSGCASGATYTTATTTEACAITFQIDPNS